VAPEGASFGDIICMASYMAFEVFCRGEAFDFILAVLEVALERPIVCSLMFAAEPSVEILKGTDRRGLTSTGAYGGTIFHRNHTDGLSWMNTSWCVTEAGQFDPAGLGARFLGSRRLTSNPQACCCSRTQLLPGAQGIRLT
jgi:hypothetical protein